MYVVSRRLNVKASSLLHYQVSYMEKKKYVLVTMPLRSVPACGYIDSKADEFYEGGEDGKLSGLQFFSGEFHLTLFRRDNLGSIRWWGGV